MGEKAYTLYNALLKLAVPPSISKTHMRNYVDVRSCIKDGSRDKLSPKRNREV